MADLTDTARPTEEGERTDTARATGEGRVAEPGRPAGGGRLPTGSTSTVDAPRTTDPAPGEEPAGGGWIDAARPRAGMPRRRGPGRAGWARLRPAVGLGLLALLVGYAVLVPWLADFDPRITDYSAGLSAPSAEHPFGTDPAGRDLLVRSAAGLRVSLLIAAVCAVVSTLIGTLVGALSGVAGGVVDQIVMRLVDTVNAVPHLLLGIVIVALYGGGLPAVIISITLTHWTSVARIVRAEVLSLRDREFVDAAISGGASRWRVTRRHLLPAVVPQAALAAVLMLPHAVWHETALSFLGLGLAPHEASIGILLDEAREATMLGGWWALVFPSALLVVATLGVAACGAAWRDRLTPRRRTELAL
ncbi:ABC transporter permease [Polymorphospora sp. NPDC051019]|uniref:ABC transporter permease n=1 Tax=Polymorphospora sp. NPDC051019 TaxID=3155725 RepID=UPI003418CB04